MAECGGEILASVTSKGYGLAAGESEAHLGSYSTYYLRYRAYQNTIMMKSMALPKQQNSKTLSNFHINLSTKQIGVKL